MAWLRAGVRRFNLSLLLRPVGCSHSPAVSSTRCSRWSTPGALTSPYSTVTKLSRDLEAIFSQSNIERDRLTSLLDWSQFYTISDLSSHPDYNRISQELLHGVPSLSPDQSAQLLTVCAQSRHRDARLLVAVARQLQRGVEEVSSRMLGLVCWSLVRLKLHHRTRHLLDTIATELANRMMAREDMEPRTIGHVCWAMASSGRWPDQLTNPLVQFIEARVNQFPLRTSSVIVWSMVKAGITRMRLFERLTEESCRYMRNTDQQSFCMLVWSLGELQLYHQEFFSSLKENMMRGNLVKIYTPRVLSTLLWAFTRVQYYDEEVMDHLAEHCHRSLPNFNSHDLSLVAYSYGFLNHNCRELLQAVAEQLVTTSHQRIIKGVYNAVWGCIVGGVYHDPLLRLAVDGIEEYTFQMLQLDICSRVEYPHLNLPTIPSPVLLKVLQESITQSTTFNSESIYDTNMRRALYHLLGSSELFRHRVISITGYELDVELLLDEDNRPIPIPQASYMASSDQVQSCLGLRHQQGQCVTEGDAECSTPLAVASDWGIEPEELRRRVARRIVIEADGPQHFAVNCPHKLGRTVLKQRQLSALGWDVISVPYMEWHPLQSVEEQASYLKQQLNKLNVDV